MKRNKIFIIINNILIEMSGLDLEAFEPDWKEQSFNCRPE